LFFFVTIFVAVINAKPVVEDNYQAREDEAIDLLRRLTREASNQNGANLNNDSKGKLPCKYRKGAWGSCDPQTKLRTRTLTLNKGHATCEPTKTLQKECKGGKKVGKQRNSSKARPNKNNRTRNSNQNPTNWRK